MNIGWVDFSRKDRDAALNALRMLRGKGAVDELGVGPIRDAFADAFFPGTSTLQTRAKYFLLIPYIIKEVLESKDARSEGVDAKAIREYIDDREHKVANEIRDACKRANKPVPDGLIGLSTMNDGGWVLRPPSELYWAGMRTLGIYEGNSSLHSYIANALGRIRGDAAVSLGNKGDYGDGGDDVTVAGDVLGLDFDLGGCRENKSKDVTSLELSPDEAEFLAKKIRESEKTKDSLMNFLIEHPDVWDKTNYREVESANEESPFERFSESLKDHLTEENRRLVELANDFNRLVYAARVLYNKMRGNTEAEGIWEEMCKNGLANYAVVNMKEVYEVLRERSNLRCNPCWPRYDFFSKLATALKTPDEDNAEKLVEKLVKDQEYLLKKDRAKLKHPEAIDSDKWIGGKWLDYRLPDAMRIIEDIVKGKGAKNA